MATEKLFNTIGVSTLNGETKVRFANDATRGKVLRKNGHTDIMLITLSESLTKLEAVHAIVDLPEFQTPEAQEAIAEFLNKNEPKAHVEPLMQDREDSVEPTVARVKNRVRVRAKKLKEALPSFESQEQTVDEDEEIPF